MRERMERFMYGRYGNDNLNNLLWIIAVAMMIVNIFIGSNILNAVCWIFLIFWFYRMFSRNHAARSAENEKFLKILDPLPGWVPRFGSRNSGYDEYSGYNGYGSYGNHDRSSYGSGYTQTETKTKKQKTPKDKTKKIFKCPVCQQKMRVPKGKGKIVITCPKCGEQFQKRT